MTDAPPPVAEAAPSSPAARARILDRGYRRYTGPRTNVRGALSTTWRQSGQRALGLRRSTWTKVLPVATVLISYVPAIVFVGMAALLPEAERETLELPTYGEYFLFIQAALILFVSFVGPEILCTDRRTGMIGIYLASPLDRDTYLAAKALATASVLALVTVGPPLLMLIANTLQGVGPDGPAGVAATLGRILVAGLVLALLYTAVSMGVSSLTDRKAFATVALLLLLAVSPVFMGALIEAAELPRQLHSLNLVVGPLSLGQLIHGETIDIDGLTLPVAAAGVLGWTLLGAVVCRTRYQALQVTR